MFQYHVLKFNLAQCMERLSKWMSVHKLKINADKTNIMLFHPSHLTEQVIIGETFFNHHCVRFSTVAKNVGVNLDCHLNYEYHTNILVATCYSSLKNISRIKRYLTEKHLKMLIHSNILSRLDYCNSLYVNCDVSLIQKIQKVQNAAARLVKNISHRTSVRNTLVELHWIPIQSRIVFKYLIFVFKIVKGLIVANNITLQYKMNNYRPEDYLQLKLTFPKTKYGKRTFEFVGPRLWNCLPVAVRACDDIISFRKMIKTFLFSRDDFMKIALRS